MKKGEIIYPGPVKRGRMICRICTNLYQITDKYVNYYYCPTCEDIIKRKKNSQ